MTNDLDSVYGSFAGLTPEDAATLLDGLATPWWIGGGWAIETFTGVSRPHQDLDVCMDKAGVGALLDHFEGTHHVWAVGSAMKPMLSSDPLLPDFAGQLWVRESAYEPWLLDILLTQVSKGIWVFKRDPWVRLPLEEATRIGDDGLRYERPEVALLHKAKHDRNKDRADLEVTLPLLESKAIDWLARSLARAHPNHPWLTLLE